MSLSIFLVTQLTYFIYLFWFHFSVFDPHLILFFSSPATETWQRFKPEVSGVVLDGLIEASASRVIEFKCSRLVFRQTSRALRFVNARMALDTGADRNRSAEF